MARRSSPGIHGLEADTWDSFWLVEAVQLLKAFALVTTDATGDALNVSMHPLVHAWACDRQSAEAQHASWLSMGCVVAFARQGGALSRAHDRPLQAHVESVVGWNMRTMFAGAPSDLVARVLVNCGWFLNQMRSDSKLFSLMSKLMTWLGLDETTVERRWLGLFELTSRNFANCGKLKKAIGLLEQVVRIRTQSLAVNYPSRLASQHTLGGAYQVNGQMKEVVVLLEDIVVRIQSQSLASDHPLRLASQHSLALAYHTNGQVKEAVALLKEVVQIRSESLAADHPDHLASQDELARVYHMNGQGKEAVELLEEVVRIKSQLLAADHPDQLASQHTLAGVYNAIKSQSLVADHPDRLASQHNLAIYLWGLEQHQRARAMMNQVVMIYQQSLDESYSHRQSSEEWLELFEQSMKG